MTKRILLLSLLAASGVCAYAQSVDVAGMETYLSPYTDPAQLLEGVAGVRVSGTDGSVNQALNVSIRGLGSARGTTGPLWIVDGVQMNTQFADNVPAFYQWGWETYSTRLTRLGTLNLYDIESIEVLKNASETAAYGSQGAAGVIIVKTKKPHSDGFNLTWNTSLGANTVGRFSQNHNIAIHTTSANNYYYLSGFYRDIPGSIANTGNRVGGARLKIGSRGAKNISFGADMSFSLGRLDSPSSTAYYDNTPMIMSPTIDWVADFDDYTKVFNGSVSAFLNVKFLKYFNWKTTGGFDANTSTRYYWYGNGTEFGAEHNGAAADSYTRNLIYNADTRIAFDGFFGGAHFVKADVGVDYHGEVSSHNTLNGTDFFNHSLRAKGLNLRESETFIRSYLTKPSTLAIFANAEYSFGKMVGIDLTFRADRLFDYDNSFVCYPGGELWFDFATLFKNAPALDRLKLYGGWGRSATNRIVPLDMYGMYTQRSEPDGLTDDQRAFYTGHNRVTVGEYNLGINASVLKNAITIDAAFYWKTTSDRMKLFCNGEVVEGTAVWKKVDPYIVNDDVMDFTDKGVEVSLTARPIWNKTVKWSIFVTGAYNDNRIDNVCEEDSKGAPVGESGLVVNSNVAGGTLGAIVDAQRNLYNSVPKFSGDFGTTLSLYGFDLNIYFDGAAGYSIVNMNRMLQDKATAITADYIEKADFVRLSRIALSYDIPMEKVRWIKGFKVSVTASNICSASSRSGWNCDVNSFNRTNLTYGVDYGSCPASPLIMAGVNVNF